MMNKRKPSSSTSKTPTTRGQLSFAVALAAPSKHDRIKQIQAALNKVIKENQALKARLSAIEIKFDMMTSLATNKAKEVQTEIEARAQKVTLDIPTKAEACVTMELREPQLQEKNAFRVHVGGLPQACTHPMTSPPSP
eukprot:c26880_g1_i1 orf=80-493(-)